MTKKEQGFVWSYEHAKARTIWDAYANPSRRKENAYHHCQEVQYIMNGYDGRITGASSHFFSYAFKYRAYGHEYLRYITYANDYDIELA